MATQKQTQRRPSTRTAQSKDKGTRGGRPEPKQQAGAAKARSQPRPAAATRGTAAGKGRVQAAPNGTAALTEEPESTGVPRWLQLATMIISIGGLGVSIYLTIAHYAAGAVSLACPESGLVNCERVTTSSQSMVFGIFPVAVLGLAFFVFMTAVNNPWGWRAEWPVIGWARLGSVCVGMLFVLYLIYTELFTLNAICLWCTSVHVLTFLLFGLVVFGASAGYGLTRQPQDR